MKKKVKAFLGATFVTTAYLSNSMVSFAEVTNPKEQIKKGLKEIKGVLLAIVVLVGVVAALKVIIAKLPHLDDPHEKSQLWKSLGSILVAVAAAAVVVVALPWIYDIFTE